MAAANREFREMQNILQGVADKGAAKTAAAVTALSPVVVDGIERADKAISRLGVTSGLAVRRIASFAFQRTG